MLQQYMGIYSRKQILVETGLILSASIITYLLNCTLLFEDFILSLLFRGILYLMDLGIFTAVLIALQAKQGFAIFYLFRVSALVFSKSFTFTETVLPAVLSYIMMKIASIILSQALGLAALSPQNRPLKQQQRRKEEYRRWGFLGILSITVFIYAFIITRNRYSFGPGILSFIMLICGVFQVRKIVNKQEQISKRISNTLHLNVLFYLILGAALGKLEFGEWLRNVQTMAFYLALIFCIIRLAIGLQSNRFKSVDAEFFDAVYPFAEQSIHKRYRSDDLNGRLTRSLDKLSKKIAVLLYFTGILLATKGQHYFWLLLGHILLKSYPLQNIETELQAYLQKKIQIKIRLIIIFPLVVFTWGILSNEKCQKQIIFDRITGCGPFVSKQLVLYIGFAVASFLSQLVRKRQTRKIIHKMLAIIAPLLPIVWAIGLECQDIQLFMLMIYSLALCLIIVRDDRLISNKGQKSQ